MRVDRSRFPVLLGRGEDVACAAAATLFPDQDVFGYEVG
jgi:hypothetical protein